MRWIPPHMKTPSLVLQVLPLSPAPSCTCPGVARQTRGLASRLEVLTLPAEMRGRGQMGGCLHWARAAAAPEHRALAKMGIGREWSWMAAWAAAERGSVAMALVCWEARPPMSQRSPSWVETRCVTHLWAPVPESPARCLHLRPLSAHLKAMQCNNSSPGQYAAWISRQECTSRT